MTTDTGKTALRVLRDRVAAGATSVRALAEAAGFDEYPVLMIECVVAQSSLDAAKALHEAVLPGWKWYVDYDGEVGLWHKTGTDAGNVCVDDICVDGSEIHPARAWLLAILDALIQETTDDRA